MQILINDLLSKLVSKKRSIHSKSLMVPVQELYRDRGLKLYISFLRIRIKRKKGYDIIMNMGLVSFQMLSIIDEIDG